MCLLEKFENLRDRVKAIVGKDADDGKIIDKLYQILTTLDAKANGLLRVNSLFLTILIALVGWAKSGRSSVAPGWYLASYIDIGGLGISAFLCMFVVMVSWKFLGKAEKTTKNGETTYTFKEEIDALAGAAMRRTACYQTAWLLTLIGLVVLSAVAIGILSGF